MKSDYDIGKINYIRKGQGKKVLLLHGWQSNINNFQPVFDNLSNNFDVIALDFPGFGNSPNPPLNWDTYDYADIVLSFIKYHNFTPCSIIGHSFGGRIAIILASKYPEYVEKIVLVNSAGLKPKRGIKYYYKVYLYKMVKFFVKLYCIISKRDFFLTLEKARKKFKIKGSSDYENAKDLRPIFLKVVNQDLSCEIKKINKQTLIVWGDKDTTTPYYMAKKLNKMIKDSGIVLLKDAGHYSYLDKFNQFIAAVNYFLSLD